ncbi:MAG: hypothetical protein ACRDK5_03375 [Solirubrobacterales bacterium]
MGADVHAPARLRRFGALAALLVLVGLFASIGPGRAVGAAKLVVLGAATPANPSCPESCQAVGKTTGFQTAIGATKGPFVVPYRGRIVAWSIKLSAPRANQIDFFKDFYGGEPRARLAVLKPIQKQIKVGHQVYKLKSQSPIEDLGPFLGTTTTFTLQSPLRVKPGQVVGLTIPTWAPAFAVGQANNTAWRASRKKAACDNADDIQAGTAHEAVGQERLYGCQYTTARLLYSATVVGEPNAPTPPKKK